MALPFVWRNTAEKDGERVGERYLPVMSDAICWVIVSMSIGMSAKYPSK